MGDDTMTALDKMQSEIDKQINEGLLYITSQLLDLLDDAVNESVPLDDNIFIRIEALKQKADQLRGEVR